MTTQTIEHEPCSNHCRKNAHWHRLLYMLLFGLLLNISGTVMLAVVVLQFIFTLAYGEQNPNLLRFSDSLAEFIRQALKFVSYNTEEKPFPFKEWPSPQVQQSNAPVE